MASWGAVQIPHRGRVVAMGAARAQHAELLLQVGHIVGAGCLGALGGGSVVVGAVQVLQQQLTAETWLISLIPKTC